MQKLLTLALGLLLCGLPFLFAERSTVEVPVTQDGKPAHPYQHGARYSRMTGTAETNPVDGPIVVLGVVLFNTGVPVYNAYAQIRDTDTGSDATVNIVAQFRFDLDTGVNLNRLPFPLRLDSGLAIDMIGIAGQAEAVTVEYLDVRGP